MKVMKNVSPPAQMASFLVVPNGPLKLGLDAKAVIVLGLIFLLATAASAATTAPGQRSALEVIWTWAPLLLTGFLFNLLISAAAMIIGTAAGVPLGVFQTSPHTWIRRLSWIVTQFFRNSPWLVL